LKAGISEILSVPYALYAEKGANKPKVEIISLSTILLTLLCLKLKTGNGNMYSPSFETCVQVIINEEGKVGARWVLPLVVEEPARVSEVEDIFKVTPDSVGIYLSTGSVREEEVDLQLVEEAQEKYHGRVPSD
jgi:hypothetical protein